MTRIVIDMQGAQSESKFRGIGRYTISLVKALIRNKDDSDEIILALNGDFPESIDDIRKTFYKLLPQENIRIWHSLGPLYNLKTQNSWRYKLSQKIREAFIENLKPDILIISSLFEGYLDNAVTDIRGINNRFPTAVLFYDLIPLVYSELYLKHEPSYEQFYSEKILALKNANLYLAISKSTAADGVRMLGLNPSSITIISSGYSEIFRPHSGSKEKFKYLLDKFEINKPYILYSGGADFRKNLTVLIDAFALLESNFRKSIQLVLSGKMPQEEIIKLRLLWNRCGLASHDLVFTGYVSDEDLVGLYSLCELYVFPSLYEGFGLPVLEAMACGVPVISSNTSSLPEVIGEEGGMFDPTSAASISNLITKVLSNDDLRTKMIAYGSRRIEQFSWDKVAFKTLSACRTLSEEYSKKSGVFENNLLENLLENTALFSLDYPEIENHKIEVANVIAQNHPCANRKAKLYVDISELAHRDAKTGIQRVVRSVIGELLTNPPELHEVIPVYALLDKSGYRIANQFLRSSGVNSSIDDFDRKIDPQPGDIFLGLDLQHHVVLSQSKYLKYLHDYGVRIHFLIYDLLPVLLPSAFPPGSSEGHASWLKEISKFDGVVCISEAVAGEFRLWLEANCETKTMPLEVGWFHLGSDIENSSPTKGISEDDQRVLAAIKCRQSFLMVGTIEPRKGHEYVLEQFIALWKAGLDINLVIVGKKGWDVDAIAIKIEADQEYGKRLFWLNGVSDECLEEVYKLSTCLIAASYGEGFGLPLIEAARYQLPIIARDIPVFREIGGGGAYFFPNKEHAELSECVMHWLKLFHSGLAPCSSVIPLLSWSQSTSQLLSCIGLSSCKD